jgi:F-type H+-transporting ATPase subunit b
MEQTLLALESILVKAIPTAVLLLLLYFYLKAMLFGPLAKTLAQRDELTKGARKAAEQSLAKAEQKAAEYEARLKDAHSEVYKQQEETRKQWLAEQAAQIATAKAAAEARMEAAKQSIEAETVAAQESLSDTSSALADQIAKTVLARRSA